MVSMRGAKRSPLNAVGGSLSSRSRCFEERTGALIVAWVDQEGCAKIVALLPFLMCFCIKRPLCLPLRICSCTPLSVPLCSLWRSTGLPILVCLVPVARHPRDRAQAHPPAGTGGTGVYDSQRQHSIQLCRACVEAEPETGPIPAHVIPLSVFSPLSVWCRSSPLAFVVCTSRRAGPGRANRPASTGASRLACAATRLCELNCSRDRVLVWQWVCLVVVRERSCSDVGGASVLRRTIGFSSRLLVWRPWSFPGWRGGSGVRCVDSRGRVPERATGSLSRPDRGAGGFFLGVVGSTGRNLSEISQRFGRMLL